MSIYIKIEDESKAKKILGEILRNYSKDIITHYLERDTLPFTGTEDVKLFLRSVVKRGGSKQTIIPPEVAEYLEIETGKDIVFILNKKIGKVYLARPTHITLNNKRKSAQSL